MLSSLELDWSANSCIFVLMFFILRGSTYFYLCIPKHSSSRLVHKLVLLYPDGYRRASHRVLILCALSTSLPFLVLSNKWFSSTRFLMGLQPREARAARAVCSLSARCFCAHLYFLFWDHPILRGRQKGYKPCICTGLLKLRGQTGYFYYKCSLQ